MDALDRREFIEDGRSLQRRKNFEAGLLQKRLPPMSLDEYIRFLDSTQKIFPAPPVSREKTVTNLNKL